VQDRGLAAYIAELVGTLILTFVICTVVVLYVATSANAQTGSDFAVVGLVTGFTLFGLVMALGTVSGGHFNPVVTLAAAALRRIDPVDAAVYILAQLSGGVLGALLVKGILLDEGRASHYGAATVSTLLSHEYIGAIVEGIGAFLVVLAFVAVAFHPRARDWTPLNYAFSYGLTLGVVAMIFGPLTGAAVNPARWFGPALIGNDFGGTWPYLVGPIVGALLAAGFFAFVIASKAAAAPESTKPGS
jgi:glycerol uptake facilitator protein